MPDLDHAEQFLAATGRILDRRRFERLFRGGDAEPVRAAVLAYRNADGGFGHGLEPDGRTPGTQPAATEQALRILDQADAWDDDIAARACDQLQAAAPAEGAAAFVVASVEGWPRAPWWQPSEGFSLISTGQIVGTLLARGIAARVGGRGHRPHVGAHRRARRPRPIRALRRPALPRGTCPTASAPRRPSSALAPAIRAVVTLDPEATGEVHGPLGFAPEPDSIARPLFDAATIAAHLDHLGRRPAGRRGLEVQLPGLVTRPGGRLARLVHGRRAGHLRRNERRAD